jgi:hypothetical protein
VWKLFVTVIAMSDTGAVSTNIAISDYNNHNDCVITAKGIAGRTEQIVGGRHFNIVVSAQCNGDNPSPPPQITSIPPPNFRRWPW